MNILFLTIAFPDLEIDSNIYSDLMLEFVRQSHSVYVMTSSERRYNKNTSFKIEKGINVLRVKTGNMQKTNIVEKGISTLQIENQYLSALNNHWSNIPFDLVIYSTPPITFGKVIHYVKKKYSAISYLLLKDIFPQNAVDIGLINENSLLYKYFRMKEKKLYAYSDFIGCMSQANVDYVIKHNSEIDPSIVEVCPNSIYPSSYEFSEADRIYVRERYDIPQDVFVCIYGGNIGKPQGIDFLMDILESNSNNSDIFFLIIGSGTEYARLNTFIDKYSIENVALYPYMKKDDFIKLVLASDCGLIFLDKRFTIPNFPSRLLTYMDCSLPVLAATDACTDIGKVITDGGFGLWSESGDLTSFKNNLAKLSCNKNMCKSMSINARTYLLDWYTVNFSSKTILKHTI